jgi:radical SAM protein with 4Fe4S-binding SPASM domain
MMSQAEKQDYLVDLEAVGRQVISDLEAGRVPPDDRFSSQVLQLLSGTKRQSFCGAGETTFGITPDGTVLPCALIDSHVARLGHIMDKPALWRQAGHRWRALQARRSQCHECFAFSLCSGGCPALMPVCGDDECDLVRKNCEVAVGIYEYFKSTPVKLLPLAGVV